MEGLTGGHLARHSASGSAPEHGAGAAVGGAGPSFELGCSKGLGQSNGCDHRGQEGKGDEEFHFWW